MPKQPIFVVGVARSGTTLLSALLSAHPRIAIMPEESFFLSSMWPRHQQQHWAQPDDLRALWDDYASTRFVEIVFGSAAPQMYERLATLPSRTPRDVFAALLDHWQMICSKPRVGEKTPSHDAHVPTLLSWFPDARVLVAVRDPRSVAASLVRMPWGYPEVDVHARRWRRSVERALTQQRHDGRVRIVQYEDLVADTERTLRDVCTWLGEDFDAQMLADERRDAFGIANWKRAVGGPLDPRLIERWRRELSARQVAEIEHVAGATMVVVGYRPEAPPLRHVQRLALQGRRVLRRVVAIAGQLRRRGDPSGWPRL